MIEEAIIQHTLHPSDLHLGYKGMWCIPTGAQNGCDQ